MRFDRTVEDNKKSIDLSTKSKSDDLDTLCKQIDEFCNMLSKPINEFEDDQVKKDTFERIRNIRKDNKRIMYSQISSNIYGYSNECKDNERNNEVSNMQENIKKVIDYVHSSQFEQQVKYDKEEYKLLESSRLLLIKIMDHINLANYQYNQLKQTDEEFKKHFDERFNSKFEESFDKSFDKSFEESYEKSSRDKLNEFSKEMNAQLLTLVGIFTALAFMIFGSLTGLSKMFSYDNVPVARLMIIGCIWGIAVLNLVFVFLFCVGKMTKTKFVSTDDKNATIWQKYPIVWWSDFIICTLLVWSGWIYYLQNREGLAVLDELLTSFSVWTVFIGSILITVLMLWIFHCLQNATGFKREKKSNSK